MAIVLSTLNARYHHASLALRYLYANMGNLREQTHLCEFTISQPINLIVSTLLAKSPQIIGFGVYIWNVEQTLAVVQTLKAQAPHIIIVLGGPEVSFDSPAKAQPICQIADYIIQGEADLAFGDLCRQIKAADAPSKWQKPPRPEVTSLQSPYPFYSDEDVAQRTIYVEASRGCPFICEFCLSSLDETVRNFPLPAFFADLTQLIHRGVRQFKFIDRTFNLSPSISTQIMEFFLGHMDHALFLHFEMVPDRLPDNLKALISKFPQGSLQFEIGIQTFNVAVAQLISRKQNYLRTQENLKFLLQHTKVYVHADLIAGLPGEDEQSFARGFDQLYRLHPHEIQVGILKRLKGTPIIRHDAFYNMKYSEKPPFEILATSTMDADTLTRLKIFSKFWDKLANSGRFQLLMQAVKDTMLDQSMFEWVMALSLFLHDRFKRTHSIALDDLIVGVGEFLRHDPITKFTPEKIAALLPKINAAPLAQLIHHTPKRQERHLVSEKVASS